MAAANKIYPFAPVVGPDNLYTDTEYEALPDRVDGNQPGVADDRLCNKALRQSSIIAAGLAQFLADNQSTDVEDSLDEATIAAMLETSVAATIPQATTTVQGKVELATAAETKAGTDTQRAVTPSGLAGFDKSFATDGYAKLPGGLVVQWGTYTCGTSDTKSFSVTFPTACASLQCSANNTDTNLGITALSASGFTIDSNKTGRVIRWLAVGY
jgi:hypothetical protein